MAQDTNYAYPLAQFAMTNNPNLVSQQGANLAGMFPGSWGWGSDPNKKVLAQQAPTTLKDPNPVDVIGGAVGKALGDAQNFGGVNTTAHNTQMGQPSNDQKPGFWDSKGGNILGSLLGIIALGGLGAGIGAISGGGRGAARGASYGMGLGTLQDLALRKQGMEAPANVTKLTTEATKAQLGAIPEDIRTSQYLKNNPSLMDTYTKAMSAKKAGETPEDMKNMLDMFDSWYSSKYGGSKTAGTPKGNPSSASGAPPMTPENTIDLTK